MNKWKLALVILLSLSLICSCTAKADKTGGSETAVENSQEEEIPKIETYKNTFSFKSVPERVVCLSYNETQQMIALGLTNKIVGIARAETGIQDCLPQYQAELKKLKEISDSTPTLEVLLQSNPDFVLGTVYSFGDYGVAPPEEFVSRNIPYYALQGTYSENPGPEDTYGDLENLGKIFRVEDRAKKLIDELKKREEEVKKNIVKGEECRVFFFNSGSERECVTAGKGLVNNLISLAGGTNIFGDQEKSYAPVSWEEVAKRNPQLIIISDYTDGESAGTLEEKIKELKSNAALKETDAVKNNRFASVKLIEVFPGLQIFDAVEKIQKAIINK